VTTLSCRLFSVSVVWVAAACGEGRLDPGEQRQDESSAGGAGGAEPDTIVAVGPPMNGFRVVENWIENDAGDVVVLRGVNRSGSEYACVQSNGIFDGPVDTQAVAAMASWGINAVRVPLNQSCWLSVKQAPAQYSGDNYRNTIVSYVNLLHRFNIVPILDLHWTRPGEVNPEQPNDGLHALPDAEHSLEFWSDVAQTFLDDHGVIFEPFNEPFPDRNRDTDEAWRCWRDGCPTAVSFSDPATYEAAGMQAIVDAIRDTGSTHLLLLGGVQFSNGLSRWLDYAPEDPEENLAVAWHVYDNNPCRDTLCWDDIPASVLEQVPIVVTEFGQRDCASGFVNSLLGWLDDHDASGYLAWTWNVYGPCEPAVMGSDGNPWGLIGDWAGAPNSEYAEAFRSHLMRQ